MPTTVLKHVFEDLHHVRNTFLLLQNVLIVFFADRPLGIKTVLLVIRDNLVTLLMFFELDAGKSMEYIFFLVIIVRLIQCQLG